MAGSPVKRRLAAELELRARAEFPEDPSANALDYVARWQAGGNTLRKLCKELSVSAPMLSDYLRITYGAPETRAALSRAREYGAHQLVEQALEIADEATILDVQVARLRVQTNQWVAERWNAAEMGTKPAGASLTVNIGSLMLDALRQPIPAPSAIASAIAIPADVLSIEESSACEVEDTIEYPLVIGDLI